MQTDPILLNKKSPIGVAIEALEVAVESGGELDRDIYLKALDGLKKMMAIILAHDKNLDDNAICPTGDDYNEIHALITAPCRFEG